MERKLLEELIAPGPRLPALADWLMNQVWTADRLKKTGSPSSYLEDGEALVCDRERLLGAAASSAYSELAEPSPDPFTIGAFFDRHTDGAAVVFDGLSLREIPRLLELAAVSRRAVKEVSWAKSAMPSETEFYVSDRLGLGLPRLGPSQLTGRAELARRGTRFYYYRNPSDRHTLPDSPERPLLWTRFPDQRYLDSEAHGSEIYDSLWEMLEVVWKNTVQCLPTSRTVLLTSDHGYIYLGSGLSDPRLKSYERTLEGKRFKVFERPEDLPRADTGLWVDRERRLAVLIGRCHNRPQAPSPSKSVFRHGGLSLMEVLTPWIILGPEEGT